MTRSKLRGAWAALLLLAAAPAGAQSYPDKPIHMIVAYVPGGATDLVARMVGQRLGDALGQPVIVDNKPGASGMIGSQYVAKASPDGYTLQIVTQTTHAVAVTLYKQVIGYDPLKDFTPISLTATSPLVLIANPDFPVKSVKDLVAYLKERSGQVNFGTGGIGSTPHMAGELFNMMAGVKVVPVPYKGENPGITDVIGGQLPYMFCNLPAGMPHVKAGKLKALAVTSAQRTPIAPELPTVAEQGIPGYETATWWGFVGPAGMPKEIVERLNKELTKIATEPELKSKFVELGYELTSTTPEQFSAYMKSEIEKWGKVVEAAGIKPE
jgi:tripartite-type tricarboxylate transporter receptor subunit TctC